MTATPKPATMPKATAKRRRCFSSAPGRKAKSVTAPSTTMANTSSDSGLTWKAFLRTSEERNGPVCSSSAGARLPVTA